MRPRRVVEKLRKHANFHKLIPLSLIVHATIYCLFILTTSGHGQQEQGQEQQQGTAADLMDSLEQICKSKLDFKTIVEFRQFVKQLQSIDAQSVANLPDQNRHANLVKCIQERDTISELALLVDNYNKERPCRFSEVTKLEQFAKKYLLANKKSLVVKFFTLFGVNVGLNCKINMLAHVKQADLEADQLDFIYSMASPTGWNVLINEYTKKTMKFGTSGHADSHVINRIARLVPDLSQVDHLDYLNFDHVMNEIRVANWAGIEAGTFQLKNGQLRANLIESIAKIIESCTNLDQFYVNSLLSMAKLKQLGLLVEFLSDLQESSPLLHKWLAATSFCQLMVRVKLRTDDRHDGQSSASTLHFDIIHDDKLLEGRRQLYSYYAKFDDISDLARENVWKVSVYDGAWRKKSESMWRPGNDGSSEAMKQLKQLMKGVEHDFQLQLNEQSGDQY